MGKGSDEINNPKLVCVSDDGDQADSTTSTQTPKHGGCTYCPQDDILRPPAEDIMEDIREESNQKAVMWCSNPSIISK